MTAPALTELSHLSYSSISSYLSCGAKWNYHYIQKVPALTSTNLVFGSAWHNTIEKFLEMRAVPTKNEKGEEIKPDLQTLWMEKWREETTIESPVMDGEKVVEVKREPRKDIDWGMDTPESFCNDGIRMLNDKDIQDGILSIQPVVDQDGARIERKLELHVPGVPIPIIGYLDIMTANGPADFKTSSKSWSADKAAEEIQPSFYLAALNQMGETIPGFRFTHFVFVKTKKPQFQRIESTRTVAELFWLFKMIKHVWDGISAGVYMENPGTWLCNPSYCEYWSICRGKR